MNALINWFITNRVAANLLMFIIIIGGILSIARIRTEVLPAIALPLVEIEAEYPGASPSEVDTNVVVPIEQSLTAIEGIKSTKSRSHRGYTSIEVELLPGSNTQITAVEIKEAINQINTLPNNVEKITVKPVVLYDDVIDIAVTGSQDVRSLRNIAMSIRQDLLALPEISIVELYGVHDEAIIIEVPESQLRRYGLSFDDVVTAVKETSVDRRSGAIKTSEGAIQLQVKSSATQKQAFEKIVLVQQPNGVRVTLGQVATVKEGLADEDSFYRYNGKNAAMLEISLGPNQDVLKTTRIVHNYIKQAQTKIPVGITLETWRDDSIDFTERFNLLKNNAISGLILVFIVCFLFLQLRVAFWVCAGIVTAFMGALWWLPYLGVSINMISLFAFIMILGIIVDDAIVVSEGIYSTQHLKGEAQREGIHRLAKPVTLAVLTSMIAFTPFLFFTNSIVSVLRDIAIVALLALAFSLIECFFILPSHLIKQASTSKQSDLLRFINHISETTSGYLQSFSEKQFVNFVKLVIEWRYLTIAIFSALLLLSLSIVISQKVEMSGMPNITSRYLTAVVEVSEFMSYEEKQVIHNKLLSSLEALEAETKTKNNVKSILNFDSRFWGEKILVRAELTSPEYRTLTNDALADRWQVLAGDLPGAIENKFGATFSDRHPDVMFSLQSTSENLTEATLAMQKALAQVSGVYNVGIFRQAGQVELNLSLKPEASNYGIRHEDLSKQIRQAFDGEISHRLPSYGESIEVIVQHPKNERTSRQFLNDMRIKTASGVDVPFSLVAEVKPSIGPSKIRRKDGVRSVTFSAQVRKGQIAPKQVLEKVKNDILPELGKTLPGLKLKLSGRSLEKKEFDQESALYGGLALIAIFSLLALATQSYSLASLILIAIPFSAIGAIWGHFTMGYAISFLSLGGMIAAAGVVINDNVVLLDEVERQRNDGNDSLSSIINAAQKRFRPIFLTSLTTFVGLAPIMFERSYQAQFLIPMVISLAFSVVFATFVTLILMPALLATIDDFKQWVSPTASN